MAGRAYLCIVAPAHENGYAVRYRGINCGERLGGARMQGAAMTLVKRLVFVGAALSVFAASFAASADDKKKPATTSTVQTTGKGGKTNTKDIASKGLGGKGGAGSGADAGGGVGGAVGDAIGGTVGGAVGGALGGFLGGLGQH